MRSLVLLLSVGLLACAPRELRITMNADNNSGQTGFAVLTDLGAKGMTVVVETTTPDITEPQLAHIHEGTCGEIGQIIGPLDKLKPLATKPGRFGSTTTLALTFEQLENGPHALNAHDARDPGVYVSCGNIPSP